MGDQTINLREFTSLDSIVISGRPKGEELRQKLSLDRLDVEPGVVTFVVPEEIVSLNSSFFLGLFTPSIQRLGVQAFDQKYRFECNQEVREDVERGKREALTQSNPLLKRK
jgi:hypothetical protein